MMVAFIGDALDVLQGISNEEVHDFETFALER